MCCVRPRLPFPIQLPADCRFKLANHIPDLNRAYSVAADERKSGKEVDTEDLVPKLGYWVLRIGHANRFPRRWVNLELANSQ